MSGSIVSDIFQSGYGVFSSSNVVIPQDPHPFRCCRCDLPIGVRSGNPSIGVWGTDLLERNYCWQCAGYNNRSGGFEWQASQREHWIRESVPLAYTTPAQIIADWLEEHGKDAAAEYMRSLLTSGG